MKKKIGFVPLLNEEDVQATNLDIAVGLGLIGGSESKTKGSFLAHAGNLNDVSAINNSTQPDTSLNITSSELVAKLLPLNTRDAAKNSDETESQQNFNLD